MKNIWSWMAWRKLGRPKPGGLTVHARGSFAFEEGAELVGRLTRSFGGLSRLTCLDLGCGPAETPIARQVLEIPWRRLISVEAFLPYLNQLRQKTARAARHDIREIRIEQIFEDLAPGEADLALLLDVLEHFPARDAYRLIVKLEKFVTRGIVLFSPVGRIEQEDLDANALQRHQSFWHPEDWIKLGYDVEVFEGFHGQLNPPATAAWAIKKIS